MNDAGPAQPAAARLGALPRPSAERVGVTARRPPHHGAAPDGANHARLRVRAGAAGASGSEPPRARASRQSLPSSLRIQLYLSSECVNRAVLSQRICGAAARRFPWDDRGARGGLCAWGARVSSRRQPAHMLTWCICVWRRVPAHRVPTNLEDQTNWFKPSRPSTRAREERARKPWRMQLSDPQGQAEL